MGIQGDAKKDRYSNILLFIMLAGFCILAIIEIFYGQKQIRMERDRLALEEENNQALWALKAEWGGFRGDFSPGIKSVETVGAANENEVNIENLPVEDEKKYDMQIVFMGDSILDHERENGGIAYLVSEECNALVYNMAIGGTTAAVLPNELNSLETWQSRGLLGVVHAIVGDISSDIFDGYRAGEILKECDFSETDYFVIEYGINDFLSGQVPQSIYLADGNVLDMDIERTYVGALETSVTLLHNHFPDAKILLISPHFCQIYEGETFIGDAYSLNYGYGTLVDFAKTAGNVAKRDKEGSVIFFDAIEQSGIDVLSAKDYLQDGIHLSAEGRRVYADCVSKLIKADFYREE